MALQVSIELDNGLSVTGSYARVDTISGYKEKLQISINYYVNHSFFLMGKPLVKSEVFTFNPSVEEGSANFIKQGYEYLKTLPEFSSAVDV